MWRVEGVSKGGFGGIVFVLVEAIQRHGEAYPCIAEGVGYLLAYAKHADRGSRSRWRREWCIMGGG